MVGNEFTEIIALHSKLAKRIKQFEQITGEHPRVKTLSELRYTLRAVLVLISENDELAEDTIGETPISKEQAKERALHALYCAYHDLVDGVLIDLTEYMRHFTENFTEASIEVLGKKRQDILETIEEVEIYISEAREHGLKRSKIYDEIIYDQYFVKLVNYKNEIGKTLLLEIVQLDKELKNQRNNDDEMPN